MVDTNTLPSRDRSNPSDISPRASDLSPQLPHFIDSSMLSAWRSCRRKFFWQYLNALSLTTKSVHLVAGGAFAAGMEAARRLAFERDRANRPTHDDLLQAAYPAFAWEWGDYIPPENTNKSFENTFQALAEYLLKHPPEEDQLQPYLRPDGSPTVEYTFAIPLEEAPPHPETGDPFLFKGRFDLLGTFQGLPCIADEKTTEQMGFQWARQWSLRGQFMGYIWACQQHGYEVQAAVIRGICILKNDYKFATQVEQYPRYLIERWYRQLLQDVEAIVIAYASYDSSLTMRDEQNRLDARDRAYPYNFADSCTSYSGCAYQTLCLAKDPEKFLNNYVHYRWDPTAKVPVKEKS